MRSRKLILTIALMACIGGLSAQTDGFFKNNNREETRENLDVIGTQQYNTTDVPLGGGIAVFVALGAGYAMMRNRRKEDAK